MLGIRNWSIRRRLLLAFAGVLIPFLAFTGVAVIGFRTLWQSLSVTQEEATVVLKRTVDLALSLDQLTHEAKEYMVSGGPEERKRVEWHLAHVEHAFRLLESTSFQVAEERALIETLRGMAPRMQKLSQELLAIPNPRADRDAAALVSSLVGLRDHAETILRRLLEIHLSEIDQAIGRATYVRHRIEPTAFAVLLLGAVGAMGLGIIISNWLSHPIQAIARGSRRLAEGDLSQRVEVDAGGELGEAASAFNAMAERLEHSAIENAGLYDAVRQRADRIAAISRLTKVISSSLDLGAVYSAFAKELKQLIPYTRMGLVACDSSGKRLQVFQLATDQLGEAKVGRVWSNGKGTGVEWVMSHRQPHIEQDLAEARLFVEDGVILKEGIRSTIRLPLIAKGEAIGALFLDDVEPRRYSESDLELLVPLGEQLAIAIENARLHDELERKVEERTSALKQTQAQLIQSGKLAAVGTLAAGVAHELNQPLMVIRGYAQELLGDARLGDEEIREDLRRIEAQTTRMVAIINHLRDFSRQSKGKREVTDLNQVVTGALTFLAQQLKTKNIAVVQELVHALPPVWADPLQIEQVLLNLVTNARDAMEAAGTGTITIRTELAQGSRVALSVTDTGPGIPGELQARIFDPFFTTKEVGKGTGLGLSICHGIVEEHGGELRMESPAPVPDRPLAKLVPAEAGSGDRGADGRGARFTIILPLSLRDDSKGDRA